MPHHQPMADHAAQTAGPEHVRQNDGNVYLFTASFVQPDAVSLGPLNRIWFRIRRRRFVELRDDQVAVPEQAAWPGMSGARLRQSEQAGVQRSTLPNKKCPASNKLVPKAIMIEDMIYG